MTDADQVNPVVTAAPGDDLRFRILGPLEIAAGSDRIELAASRQQVVLATLLLSANSVVTVGWLQEALYGQDPPPTSRSQAQITVSALRRLFAARGHGEIISSRPQGYALRVGRGLLDAQQFEELVAAARAARDAGLLDQAVASYRDALRLWRGPALDGLDSLLLQAAASRLDEQRIAANEDRISLELDLGRHRELVGELTELVEEHPLREELRGQLMLALYRCDRPAEALQVYRQGRRTMVDELGIEPCERLRQLEHSILTSDPALALPARPANVQAGQVPNLLPADIADFTGRAEEIEQIRRRLRPGRDEEARLAAPVVVIVGQGGVGKSSLAVHAARGVAVHFPDGQLFADLHGGSAHPVGPMQVLARFLRALGVPGPQIPDGLDERAEVYRNLLADRRILVVLDDALAENQVLPLLPGSAAAAVMITSRRRLAGLAGAAHVEVGVFDPARSLDLLARVAGPVRVEAEPSAAAQVAALCGHLPLALRIAGARLSARPHWSIGRLVDRLADETRRLDELRHGDMGIRASISLSYESAGEPARRLFRRLALLDQPAFSGWLSPALLGRPADEAEDALDDLVGAHLVEAAGAGTGAGCQYRFHDLIRVFAAERLAAEEPADERKAALERALGALLDLAAQAHRRYYDGDQFGLQSAAAGWPLPRRLVDELVSDPMSWYWLERTTLACGVRQAAEAGLADLCWGLAFIASSFDMYWGVASLSSTFFQAQTHMHDSLEICGIALQGARKAGDIRGEATMLYSIGSLHLAQQRLELTRQECAAAARLFEEAGHERGAANAIRTIGVVDRFEGRLDDATRRVEHALTVFRRTGDQVAEAYALQNLAQVHMDRHEVGHARDLLSEALRLVRDAGCGRVEAQVLRRIGEVLLRAGELADAVRAWELALAKVREYGDARAEAYMRLALGAAKVQQGEPDVARGLFQQALELAAVAGERIAEIRALLGLGELALAAGEPARAVVHAQRAADLCRNIGVPHYETQAAALLGNARGAAAGDADRAASAGPAAVRRR